MPRGGARPGAGRPKKDPNQVKALVPHATRMRETIAKDVLDKLLATLPPDVSAHQLLNAIVRSKEVPALVRIHAATKVLPYEVAKPSDKKTAGAGGILFKFE